MEETVGKLAARFGGRTNSLVSQLDTFRLNEQFDETGIEHIAPASEAPAPLHFAERSPFVLTPPVPTGSLSP
jgi:hypothetical protein